MFGIDRNRAAVADDAVPEVAAESSPPFWSVTELAKRWISPPVPVPLVLVKMPLPVPSIRMDWAGLARPCTTISPDAPAPVDVAVMVPPEARLTVFAFTVIVPPVAEGAVPEVAADNVPPFWKVTDLQ